MKKFLAFLMLMLLAFALSSCGGEEQGNPEGDQQGDSEQQDVIRICFVTAELGDHSFADNSNLSLQRIADTHEGVEYICSQVGADGVVNGVREAAQNGYDIVVYGGPNADIDAMIKNEGADYPDTLFYEYGVSNDYAPASENHLVANFAASHSSFIGGIVASGVSQSKVCAYIGGQEEIGLYEWMIGYVQGVEYNGGTTAYSWVAGSSPWSDPAKAKELSIALNNNYGADVFWGCAGQSGDGCFAAVLELREKTGRDDIWGIGVDADQHAIFAEAGNEEYAEVVLTSCIQMCCEPLNGIVETMLAGGEVETGLKTYGIAEGACGIADNEFYQANTPEEVKEKVAQAQQEILNGEMEVVSAWGMSVDELNAFLQERTINFAQANI